MYYVMHNKKFSILISSINFSNWASVAAVHTRPCTQGLRSADKTQDQEVKTQDQEVKTQDQEVKIQDQEVKTQDQEVKTQDQADKTQNQEVKTQDQADKIQDVNGAGKTQN